MVFPFKVNLDEKSDRYFIWDAESGSLFGQDEAAFLVCKKRYGSLDETEIDAYSRLDKGMISEINEEFDRLEEAGIVNAPEKRLDIPFSGEIKALCLHICHDCNLRCAYCFAKDGTYNTERDYMSFEVGKAALDFLFEKSGKRHNLEVDFFGGEPLMNFDAVKKIVAYGKEKASALGKAITFTLTTNGVMLDEKAREYLNKEMDNVVISIDGRKEVHDALRKTPRGGGSYDAAVKNALEFRKIRGDGKYYIRGTFTKNNLDFSADVMHLNDLGFDQISMEPVVLEASSPYAIGSDKNDVNLVLCEYEKLATEYVKRRKSEKWFNFFHFMLDLDNGPCQLKRLRGCGAGSEYLAVTPTGDIYPCHQFAGGNPEYQMGNVLTGEFKPEIQKKFADVNVYSKEGCGECPAKYYCSGGCAANSLHFAGGLNKPHKESCEMMKKRFLLSLAINAIERE